jgi:hypothetical protein
MAVAAALLKPLAHRFHACSARAARSCLHVASPLQEDLAPELQQQFAEACALLKVVQPAWARASMASYLRRVMPLG